MFAVYDFCNANTIVSDVCTLAAVRAIMIENLNGMRGDDGGTSPVPLSLFPRLFHYLAESFLYLTLRFQIYSSGFSCFAVL